MWFRSCIGNLNKKMHPLEFYWTGGVKIIYDRPCYIGLGFYRAGSNVYWRDKNSVSKATACHPELRTNTEEKFISAALLF